MTDRETLQALIDEQLKGAASAAQAGAVAKSPGPFLEVERLFMNRARALASVLLYAADAKPEPVAKGPRLVYSRASIT